MKNVPLLTEVFHQIAVSCAPLRITVLRVLTGNSRQNSPKRRRLRPDHFDEKLPGEGVQEALKSGHSVRLRPHLLRPATNATELPMITQLAASIYTQRVHDNLYTMSKCPVKLLLEESLSNLAKRAICLCLIRAIREIRGSTWPELRELTLYGSTHDVTLYGSALRANALRLDSVS